MKAQGRGAWINFAALSLVNLLWAAKYPAYKIAGDTMEVATLNFWMLLFAAILLVPLWQREKLKRKDEQKALQWRTLYEFLLLGDLGTIPASVMLSWGISHSSASNAAVLSLTIPILMTGLGFLMLPQIPGGALTVAGTATLTFFDGRRSAQVAKSGSKQVFAEGSECPPAP